MSVKNTLRALKGRELIKPSIAYIAISWIVLQVCSIVFPILNIPEIALRVILIILITGFPIYILLRAGKIQEGIPQKIVTFVFSDIEHSTRLAQKLRERYPEILERYRATIDKAIKNNYGRNIDTAGDGVLMSFSSPKSAVLAALQIQDEFQRQQWAVDISLKVRIGIHTGIALDTGAGYTGTEVHRTSLICHAGHGGQILISSETLSSLEDGFQKKHAIKSLGKYVLQDFNEATELHQVNLTNAHIKFPQLKINPDEKKVAVLPFSNQSEDVELDYIGDGLAEEIILALGKVQGLRVVSRSSAFALKNASFSATALGAQLNVSSILEGRLKKDNEQLQIVVELIDTESGFDIWSEKYDEPTKDLVQIKDDITIEVSKALDCLLVPEELGAIQNRQTQVAEAYNYYLRGRRFYLQFSSQGIELALQMFKKAIEADSNYSLAYAGIADCYSYQYQHLERSAEIIDKANKASKKAIDLGKALPEGYASRGIVMSLIDKFDEAEKLFQHAIDLNPNLFLGWFHYARACYADGRIEKAARLFKQANRVEPDDFQSLFLSAQAYQVIGYMDIARELRQKGVEITDRILELNPGDTRALYLTANALVYLGQKERSVKLLARALSLEPEDSMLLYNAGCVYALLGMPSEALSCLERSYNAGLTLKGWYENDGDLGSIKNHPRFIKLLNQMD